MTIRIHYETPNGIETVDRDERHYEKSGVIYAYDRSDDGRPVIEIPTSRVIRVTHTDQDQIQ